MKRVRLIAVAAIIVATIVLLERVVVVPFQANETRREVTATTAAALSLGTDAEADAMARANLTTLARLASDLPRDAQVQILIAANYRVLRRFPEAIEAYDEALAWEPTAYVYLNRGVTELAAGRRAPARASFDRAILFDPSMRAVAAEAEQAYDASLAAK